MVLTTFDDVYDKHYALLIFSFDNFHLLQKTTNIDNIVESKSVLIVCNVRTSVKSYKDVPSYFKISLPHTLAHSISPTLHIPY